MEIIGNVWKRLETIFTPKNPDFFASIYPYFTTSNKIDYKKHTETINHKISKWKRLETLFTPKTPNMFVCVKNVYVNNSVL
jgi:hypothetical protein